MKVSNTWTYQVQSLMNQLNKIYWRQFKFLKTCFCLKENWAQNYLNKIRATHLARFKEYKKERKKSVLIFPPKIVPFFFEFVDTSIPRKGSGRELGVSVNSAKVWPNKMSSWKSFIIRVTALTNDVQLMVKWLLKVCSFVISKLTRHVNHIVKNRAYFYQFILRYNDLLDASIGLLSFRKHREAV